MHWLILVAPSCLRSHNARYIMLKSLKNDALGYHHDAELWSKVDIPGNKSVICPSPSISCLFMIIFSIFWVHFSTLWVHFGRMVSHTKHISSKKYQILLKSYLWNKSFLAILCIRNHLSHWSYHKKKDLQCGVALARLPCKLIMIHTWSV